MKALAAVGTVALILCAPALAKFQISVAATDTTPAVRQRVTMILRSERKLDYNLRLIAVAPGKNIFRVVAAITDDTSRPDPNIAATGLRCHLSEWRRIAGGDSALPERRPLARSRPELGPAGVVIPAGVARLTLAVR